MTYRVRMLIKTGEGQLEIATNFAGCTDEEDAKAKASSAYTVVKFKEVKEAKAKK